MAVVSTNHRSTDSLLHITIYFFRIALVALVNHMG